MDYNSLRATSKRLIESFGSGRSFTYSHDIPGVYDPIEDTMTGGSTVTATVKGVFSKLNDSEIRTLPDDLTIQDAAKILVPALDLPGLVPEPGDKITSLHIGETYVVRNPGRSRPDGDPIYYALICGKAEA